MNPAVRSPATVVVDQSVRGLKEPRSQAAAEEGRRPPAQEKKEKCIHWPGGVFGLYHPSASSGHDDGTEGRRQTGGKSGCPALWPGQRLCLRRFPWCLVLGRCLFFPQRSAQAALLRIRRSSWMLLDAGCWIAALQGGDYRCPLLGR